MMDIMDTWLLLDMGFSIAWYYMVQEAKKATSKPTIHLSSEVL